MRHANPLMRHYYDWLDHHATKKYLKAHLQSDDVILFYCDKDITLVEHITQIAHSRGAKVIRDLCELPFGTNEETAKCIASRKIVLEEQFPKMDGFICISDTLVDLAKSHASATCKIIKIPILVDFSDYDLPDLYSETDTPYLFHAGTLFDQKDGITGMMEGFALARKKWKGPLHFYLTGNLETSPQRHSIEDIIIKYQLGEDVKFLGYLTEKELRDYLSKAALTIINKYPTQQNHYCFSTKMAEYLAASKPLIITRVGEAINWVEDKKSAIIVDPQSPGQLADAIIFLLSNPLIRREIGSNGKQLCKEVFDYNQYGQSLYDYLHSL